MLRRMALLFALAASLPTTTCLAQPKAESADEDRVYPVALLPLAERGDDSNDRGRQVTELLFANLATDPSLMLVDRMDLEAQLAEQELSMSGMVEATKANQVGYLTGAKILVTGCVLQVDESLFLVAKVMGTETSRVVGVSVRGSSQDNLADLTKQLAAKVARRIAERGDELVAAPRTRSDRISALQKELAGATKPTVRVHVRERHVGEVMLDPAAVTELSMLCQETGFTVVDREEANAAAAEVLIEGEALSEFAARHGNLISVKARLEVKAVDRVTGEVRAVDRQTSVAVDLTEQIASKAALQQAAATLAERMLPKLVYWNGRP